MKCAHENSVAFLIGHYNSTATISNEFDTDHPGCITIFINTHRLPNVGSVLAHFNIT